MISVAVTSAGGKTPSLESVSDSQGQRQGHYHTSRQSETWTVKGEENTIHLSHWATHQVTTQRRWFRLRGYKVINSYTALDLSTVFKGAGSTLSEFNVVFWKRVAATLSKTSANSLLVMSSQPISKIIFIRERNIPYLFIVSERYSAVIVQKQNFVNRHKISFVSLYNSVQHL